MTAIKTDIIKSSTSEYLRHLVLSWLGKWWWTIVIPIVIPLCLGAYTGNIAWYITALMLLFLCVPTVLFFVFNLYALRPEVRRTMHSHVIEFTPKKLTVTYLPLADSEINPPSPVEINLTSISNMGLGGKGIALNWSDKPWDFISIPYSSFSTKEDSIAVIQWINDAIPTRWKNN